MSRPGAVGKHLRCYPPLIHCFRSTSIFWVNYAIRTPAGVPGERFGQEFLQICLHCSYGIGHEFLHSCFASATIGLGSDRAFLILAYTPAMTGATRIHPMRKTRKRAITGFQDLSSSYVLRVTARRSS